MHTNPSPATLVDEALLREAKRLVRVEHGATTALVRALMEVDARRLYLQEGCASLFVWCVQELRLDEAAAYNRIEVARAATRLPAIIDALEHGGVSLTAVRLLAPHLNAANHAAVLGRASGKTTREIHLLVAELAPRPDVPCSIRRLAAPVYLRNSSRTSGVARGGEATLCAAEPSAASIPALGTAQSPSTSGPSPATATHAGGSAAAPPTAAALATPAATEGLVATRASAAIAVPLSPARFKLQMTISAETHAKLRHAQNLLRHAMPGGNLADIVDRALTVLVRELERQRLAATDSPRPAPRRTETQPEEQSQQAPQPQQAPQSPQRPRGKHTRTRSERSRRIPAFVRRAVWQRDRGQCAFIGPHGRCRERAWLEFHHVLPYAAGGPASIENISLRCRAHNAFEGALFFGKDVRARPGSVSGPAG